MTDLGLVLFGLYLLIMIVLDVAMIISLIRPGDERRQMIIWKAGNWTFVGITGSLVISIIESIIKVQEMSVNPFIVLSTAATIYFLSLMYYRKKFGG